ERMQEVIDRVQHKAKTTFYQEEILGYHRDNVEFAVEDEFVRECEVDFAARHFLRTGEILRDLLPEAAPSAEPDFGVYRVQPQNQPEEVSSLTFNFSRVCLFVLL